MIAFNCEQCTKALIVPDARARGSMHCPACNASLQIPDPPRRSRWRGWWKPLVFMLVLAPGAFLWYRDWSMTTGMPARLQQEFAAQLARFSPGWTEIVWKQCKPESGYYTVHVTYLGEPQSYKMEATSIGGGETIIRINPGPENYLAQAEFRSGELLGLLFLGRTNEEKLLLDGLCRDLESALGTAIRKVKGN